MKRHKAWIGAAIGAAAGIASTLIGNSKKKEAERQNEIEANRQQTMQMASALTNKYANQDYIDNYYDRVSFKLGGKRKRRKCNLGYEDRLENTEIKDDKTKNSETDDLYSNNKDDNSKSGISSPVEGINTNGIYSSLVSGVGDIVNSAISYTPNNTISKTPIINGKPTTYNKPITVDNFNIDQTPINRLQAFRCGGRKRIKR